MSINLRDSPRRDGSSDPAAVDLFLSYNSRDRAAVQQVRTLLGACGVSVFYDRESLGLGLDWFEPLERALGRVRGVIVLLGPDGLGRWQRREMALALDRQTREATFPVIPVLLPGSEASDYSGFLLLNTYADLRGGLNDPNTLDAIMRAVRDTAAAGEIFPPPGTAAICPYRGLNAFREEDAPLFFGRDRLVDEPEQGLLHKVLTCSLVAVVGASGSGKSSVVRAGLLPRLQLQRESPSRGTWDAVVFRPGKYPFLNLAMALEAARNPEASDAARETAAAALGKGWASGDLPFELSLGRAREALRVDRLLVVMDQFEELVTLTPKDGRQPFLSHLLAATGTESKITVLLTLRADYYGLAIGLDRGLCDGIQRGLVNVGAMTRDERRAAIEGPARRVGLEFEPGLVDRLLDDVGDEPGNLPLLEFALTELWERREGRRLTNAAYDALGRVAGAIGRRADAVFAGLTGEQQAAAPRLFGRLVRVTAAGEEGADTRQRVCLGDLDEASRAAVEPFVAGRLLVTARDPGPSTAEAKPDDGPAPAALDGPTTVEVAHEALIRRWEQLRDWIKEDRAFLLWRQRLGFQIAEWESSGRDKGALLRGTLLKEACRFARSRRDDLNDREREFLAQSESQCRRRLLGIRVITILAILAILGGVGLYVYHWASTLIEAIQIAEVGDVPRLVKQLTPYRILVNPLLARSLQESKEDTKERLNFSLALLPVDAGQVEYLYNRLLNTNPVELLVIREAMKDHREMIVERLWAVLENPQADSGQRFHAACALASYDPAGSNSKWDAAASRFIADRLLALVITNPSYYTPLIEMMRPMRNRLLAPLTATFLDKNKPDAERFLATSILADYAGDQPNVLADLLKDADGRQFAILFSKVDGDKTRVVASMRDELSRTPPEHAGEEVREGLARRQANAAIVLFRLGEVDPLWLSLRQGPAPWQRTYLIHRLAPYSIDPQSLFRRLPVEPSPSARTAILMSLGEFPPGQLPDGLRRALVERLLDLYARDPDPGVHAAAGWLLSGWGFTNDLREIDRSLAGSQPASGRYWFVNKEGQTFVVIPGPVTFLMGSPRDEPGRNEVEGPQHSRTIPRSFAVAAREVTVREFRRFLTDVGLQADESFQGNLRDFSPNDDGPILYVTWFEAAKYCRWLSDREGVKPDQMCYPEVKDIKPGMRLPKDYLTWEGYRLPTEGEWEFVCRSGTSTPWEFGGEELMDRYARFLLNAKGSGMLHQQSWPTGQLKPNGFGLFDMHGNVYEWCHDRIYRYPVREDREESDLVVTDGSEEKNHRLIRGGSFADFPSSLRSAYRDSLNPSIRLTGVGFRVARTCARP